MDTAHWPPQEVIVKPMDDKISNTCSSSLTAATSSSNTTPNHKLPSTSLERKIRPQKDEAVNCPRCNSTNTKFCYYNNYSLTQPRYFCKTCKRYWTEGGSLRNIPVGGGSRKNKRSSSSSSSTCTSPASKRISSHDHLISNPNTILTHQPQDLNLGFPPTQLHHDFTSLSQFIQLPTMDSSNTPPNPSKGGQLPNSSVDHLSAMELLNGLTSSRGLLTPFIPMAVPDPNDNGGYSSGYPSLQDFKPSLNFSLDGIGNGYGSLQGEVQHNGGGGGRLLFPFEDLKQTTNDATADQTNCNNNNNNDEDGQSRDEHGGDTTTGFWSGMMGAGGSW